MSRYTFEHGDYLISIGWDAPFDTYFVMVEDTTDTEADEPLIWIGMESSDFTEN